MCSVISDSDIAWATGLFEGEGCIMISFPPSRATEWKNPQIKLSLSMTDRDVVEEFFRVVECGRISPEQIRRPPLKSFYVWTVGNLDDAERILLSFMPRLGSRRKEKALAALEEIKRHRSALIRTCDYCGSEFEAKRDVGRFCSTPCYMRTYYAKHRGVRVADRTVANA